MDFICKLSQTKIDFPKDCEDVYNKYKMREITGSTAIELLDLKRNTFYELKKDWENND
ncbi:hypothetical protein [Marinisporobacter balticus]|uniref:hypothetical protein n=1 Tax=Marinisporobacter balticus TaxID=2018667 RepID=UPI001404808E|nr:hypothetical protein [Marinisporobacter balticus]